MRRRARRGARRRRPLRVERRDPRAARRADRRASRRAGGPHRRDRRGGRRRHAARGCDRQLVPRERGARGRRRRRADARVAARSPPTSPRVGVNLDFAPVADVNTNPQNPVIGIRSFGSDAELVARHVAAFVRGLQSAGVAACAKHFPGHGDTCARLAPRAAGGRRARRARRSCRFARRSRPACGRS